MINKKSLKNIGIGFIFIGILLVVNSFPSITGFVIIGDVNIITSRTIGLIFIIAGILSFTTGRLWNHYRVDLVIKEYESGTLNPVEAALKINDELYPGGMKINGVDYRGENKETIRTEEENIPIMLKDKRKARDLALALYEVALINDRKNARNCELHFGKQASSKHHRAGLDRIVKNFENRYQKDLQTAQSR